MIREDVIKIQNYIDSIIVGYSYCFNCLEPVSEAYLSKFANDRHLSTLFNDEYVKLQLDIIKESNITSMYDLDWFLEKYPKINKELKEVFVPYFETKMKEQLKINRKIRKAEIEAEKQAENEAKGKVGKKKKETQENKED